MYYVCCTTMHIVLAYSLCSHGMLYVPILFQQVSPGGWMAMRSWLGTGAITVGLPLRPHIHTERCNAMSVNMY